MDEPEFASPSVEQQLLGWCSDSTDDDGFKLVSYKKSWKKRIKMLNFVGVKRSIWPLLMRAQKKERVTLRLALGSTQGKILNPIYQN